MSANIPLSMKYNLIHSIFNDQSNLKDNQEKSFTSRKIFKKEEDEKIKQLVEIFGSSNWDLISYFIDGRTAKQWRDRYSNYLAPGFFQGEWSEEEDSLLIKLYNENGSKWSIIQKSFPNRSSNNIKNRWKYFIYQNLKISKDKNKKEIKKNNEKSLQINQKLEPSNNINSNTEDNVQFDNLFNDDNQAFFQQENVFYDSFSNIENDNDIPFYWLKLINIL